MEQRCETCSWMAERKSAIRGTIGFYRCACRPKVKETLPVSATLIFRYVTPDDGANCPCWKERES